MAETIGQAMRAAREEKNISISQVSDELFIRITYLQAIENDRPEILPSPVQGRGFVRMYAEYLKMDVKTVLDAWDHPEIPFGTSPDNHDPSALDVPGKIESTQPLQPLIDTPAFSDFSLPEAIPVEKDPVAAIFKQIGSELKNRRESLGLTYEDAEIHTLVRSFYLQLMEEGNFDALPSSVQARGMLNNYAAFLNLDVDGVMLRYANALQLQAASRTFTAPDQGKKKKKDPAQKPVKKVSRFKQFMTPDLFVGITVLIGMAAIIIYSAVTISEFKARAITPTVDLDRLFAQQFDESLSTATPASDGSATATPAEFQADDAEFLPPMTLTPVQETPQEALEGPIQLYIEANQRAFLQVRSDGNIVFSGRTLPGHTYPFDGNEMIEVQTGNAAAFKITYNHQSLGILGTLGQNLTLQFANNFVMTPTPAISPTLTATFAPTYTPEPVRPTATQTITPYIP